MHIRQLDARLLGQMSWGHCRRVVAMRSLMKIRVVGSVQAVGTVMGGLNNDGGGVYATQWTSDYIRIWFFPRSVIPANTKTRMPTPAVSCSASVALLTFLADD